MSLSSTRNTTAFEARTLTHEALGLGYDIFRWTYILRLGDERNMELTVLG